MMDERSTRVRSIGAIAFDLILLGFVLLLVGNSLTLRPGVGTVPLFVGIPTLLAIVAILIWDGIGRTAGRPEGDEEPSRGIGDLIAAAEQEEDEAAELPADPKERRRQLAFAAWTIGFVILATLTSFYVAVPIALVAILVAVRLHWLAIILIVAGTLAGLYGLFDLFLRVRL